jgi:hypothetical protein
MSIETDRFDGEGGAMYPVAPVKVVENDFEDNNSCFVIGHAMSAFGGFLVGLLATWIF